MATERCIFCGGQPTTKEHVFSRWTHKLLPQRKPGRARSEIGLQYVDRLDPKIIKLPGQLRDWQVKCVCGGTNLSCNNGWMRSIENAAAPILTDMILGKGRRLNLEDQERIATWAILKAMVTSYDNRADVRIHHTQRRYIMTHKTAPTNGWAVWIADFNRDKWIPEWVSRPMLLLPKSVAFRKKDFTATYFNANATTQIIGRAFIHVIHFPMPRFIRWWRFPIAYRGMLYKIWPPTQSSIKWPGPALDDTSADALADAVFAHVRRVQQQLITSAPDDIREKFLRIGSLAPKQRTR